MYFCSYQKRNNWHRITSKMIIVSYGLLLVQICALLNQRRTRNREWNGRWTSPESGGERPARSAGERETRDTVFWFLLLRNFCRAFTTVCYTWSCRLHHCGWMCEISTEKNKVRDNILSSFCFHPLCAILIFIFLLLRSDFSGHSETICVCDQNTEDLLCFAYMWSSWDCS